MCFTSDANYKYNVTQPTLAEKFKMEYMSSTSRFGMLRGRKRKLPSVFIPEPYYHDSDSEHEHEGEGLLGGGDIGAGVGVKQDDPVEQGQDFEQNGAIRNNDDVEMLDEEEEEEEDEEEEEQEQEQEQQEEEEEEEEQEEEVELEEEQEQEVAEETEGEEAEEEPHHEQQEQEQQRQEEDHHNEEQDHQNPREGHEQQHEVHERDIDTDEDSDDDEDGMEDVDDDEDQDYQSILDSLIEKWMLAEVDHTISKLASNKLWKLAFHFIPRLMQARSLENVTKKVPQFNHIRKCLYDKRTPTVNLEIAYKNKNTDEVVIVQDTKTPKSRFPPDTFDKMYEMASVKVINN